MHVLLSEVSDTTATRDYGRTVSVVVVGAGPVGLMTTLQLARRGIPVRLVDQRAEPTTESRAVGVHARTLELLDSLGLADEAIAEGAVITSVRMQTKRRHLTVDLAPAPTRYPFVLDIAQPDFEALLTRACADYGVLPERGVTVRGVTQTPDSVAVDFTEGESLHADYVVGCDGARSSVRRGVGANLTGDFHGMQFVIVDADLDTDLPRNAMCATFAPDGALALVTFPLREPRMRLVLPADDGLAADEGAVQRRLTEVTDGRSTVTRWRWITPFEVKHGQVSSYRHGRVFLAGDAAHIHSPIGGHGMNTGLQDAANLGWKLAEEITGTAPAGLLDTYDLERHPVAAAVIRSTSKQTRAMSWTGPRAIARSGLIKAVTSVPLLRHDFLRQAMELTIAYPDSPLSAGAAVAGVRPGDFAVGTSSEIANAWRSTTGWFDIVADVSAEAAVVVRDWAVPTGTRARVRPDGYIGELTAAGSAPTR